MGHAQHYLERLERVEGEVLDLAKALYMDSELVRHLIGSAKLPDEAERVAIELDYGEWPPCVVLTREGQFVTCLARGMKHELPTIRRSAINKAQNLTERVILAAQEVQRQELSWEQLVQRLLRAGPLLTREEYEQLQPWTSLYYPVLMELMWQLFDEVNETRMAFIRTSRKRMERVDEELLWTYWNHTWALGPLVQLLADEHHMAELVMPGLTRLSWHATRHGLIGLALRGWWAAARVGKLQYDQYKADFQRDNNTFAITYDTGFGLFAMALRHNKLHAETTKLFNPGRAHMERLGTEDIDLETTSLETLLGTHLYTHLKMGREDLRLLGVKSGQSMLSQETQDPELMPPDSPHIYTDPDQVPEHLILGRLAILPMEYRTGEDRMRVSSLTPFFALLAMAPANETFLPGDYMKHLPRYGMEFIRHHLQTSASYYKTRTPRRRTKARISRNAPCPCGSGKKYKRCCLS